MRKTAGMIPEGRLEATEHGLVSKDEAWFLVNATAAPWRDRAGRGTYCDFGGDTDFPQVGINIQVLQPGEAMALYLWEADQVDFLVLAG